MGGVLGIGRKFASYWVNTFIGTNWKKGGLGWRYGKRKEVRTTKSNPPSISSICSKGPYFADRLLEVMFRGAIVGSLFESLRCPERIELISGGTASLETPPELEMEILQLISELTEMLCWCTGYGDDSVDKVDILSILLIKFCDVFIRYLDRFKLFLISECAEVDAALRPERN